MFFTVGYVAFLNSRHEISIGYLYMTYFFPGFKVNTFEIWIEHFF